MPESLPNLAYKKVIEVSGVKHEVELLEIKQTSVDRELYENVKGVFVCCPAHNIHIVEE